jgi:hypothetical protein
MVDEGVPKKKFFATSSFHSVSSYQIKTHTMEYLKLKGRQILSVVAWIFPWLFFVAVLATWLLECKTILTMFVLVVLSILATIFCC